MRPGDRVEVTAADRDRLDAIVADRNSPKGLLSDRIAVARRWLDEPAEESCGQPLRFTAAAVRNAWMRMFCSPRRTARAKPCQVFASPGRSWRSEPVMRAPVERDPEGL